MSWSVPRNVRSPLPAGERVVVCDECGVKWLRSSCRRDGAGRLVCPQETGRDEVTLDRANQAASAAIDERLRNVPPDW